MSALTDERIDNIWIFRVEIHDGDLTKQLRDFARNIEREVLAAHPGQPEPPARERRHWKPEYNTDPIQRACGELPEGWEIQACMENGAGWVDVYDPTGEKLDFDSDADHFDWRIHEAIDFAIDAAEAAINTLQAEATDCGCATNEACKMKTDGSCWMAD